MVEVQLPASMIFLSIKSYNLWNWQRDQWWAASSWNTVAVGAYGQCILEWGGKTVAAAKSLQSCPTLCDPIDGSPPGYPVPGILQARTLEWVAISFSSAWKWKVKVKSLSHVQLLVTSWTAAYQAPLSMGFSRQEYWSGVRLPLPSPGGKTTVIQTPTPVLPL